MSDAVLDPQEMEAIQAAIRETGAPSRRAPRPAAEPTRLALITDDRTAELARPLLLDLASRITRAIGRTARSYLPGTWQLDVVSAEIIDGTTAKEEMRGGWISGLRAADAEAPGELAVAVHGAVIDIASAHRCGAAAPKADGDRPPSPVSLRLFQPTGKAVLDGCMLAWREKFRGELAVSGDLGIVSRLVDARSIVRVALAFAGSVTGRIQIYARPESILEKPAALAAFKAHALRIAEALAHVPVEVVVELGTLRMPLQKLRKLERGATFTLQGFVDSRVPVYCEGVLKAWARPVVCRGVLAVQIETVIHGQGTRS